MQRAGYSAALPAPPAEHTAGQGSPQEEADELAPLRARLITSIVLTVPVIAMAMIPPLQFTHWQWLSLTLAAPVVVYAGWPFHKAAWTNLRHGAATMDTLVSLGTVAALARPTSAWRRAPAPTPPSRPPTSLWSAVTCGWPPTRSACPAGPWPSWCLAGVALGIRGRRPLTASGEAGPGRTTSSAWSRSRTGDPAASGSGHHRLT